MSLCRGGEAKNEKFAYYQTRYPNGTKLSINFRLNKTNFSIGYRNSKIKEFSPTGWLGIFGLNVSDAGDVGVMGIHGCLARSK